MCVLQGRGVMLPSELTFRPPWAVNSPGENFPVLMIGGSSITMAFYIAYNQCPENEHIKTTLLEGLPNVAVFTCKTPVGVIRWLRDWHNNFHGGSDLSVLELLLLSRRIVADWSAHCVIHAITARNSHDSHGGSRDSLCWKFIQDGKYDHGPESMLEFIHTRTFLNIAEGQQWYHPIHSLLEQCGDFQSVAVPNKDRVHCSNKSMR